MLWSVNCFQSLFFHYLFDNIYLSVTPVYDANDTYDRSAPKYSYATPVRSVNISSKISQ